MAWIFGKNLGPWCDAVSLLFGTALTPSEWEELHRGVSSAEGSAPFRFRLGGPDGLEVSACMDDPRDVVHVWVDPGPLDEKIGVITMMCRFFTIRGRVSRDVAPPGGGWVVVGPE